MSAFIFELKKLCEDLNTLPIRWALIGGMGYSIYADPRTTKDIDVAVVSTNNEKIEDIVNALLQKGYKNKQVLMHVEPTHKLGVRVSIPTKQGYDIPIDFLTQSCGIEKEIVESANLIEILPSIIVPVASISHILAMKVLAGRIQDIADASALLKVATNTDLDETKKALTLMSERGFAREKNLQEEFAKLISSTK